jgi:hypothetical protein
MAESNPGPKKVETLTRSEARRRKYITTAILVVGLGAAVTVYFIDRARPENPLGYDPLETKKYIHDLELYGGEANVIAAEFREWFAGLWYGRQLAFTIAVITGLLVGAVRLTFAMRAMRNESEPGSGAPVEPVSSRSRTARERERFGDRKKPLDSIK